MTFAEIRVLAEEPAWWEEIQARLTDGGTLEVLCEENGWSYGALWKWINEAGTGRRGEYDVALEGKAERAHDQCLTIADDGGDPKHRTDERRRSAKVWNRKRYGEEVKVNHSGVLPVLNIVVLGEGVGIQHRDIQGRDIQGRVVDGLTVASELEPELEQVDEI